MSKEQFTKVLSVWLKGFLASKFPSFELEEVIIPDSNVSNLNNNTIKSMPGYSSWDFNQIGRAHV